MTFPNPDKPHDYDIDDITSIKDDLTPEQIEAEKYSLVNDWQNAKIEADKFKDLEMDLRKKIVAWIGDPEIAKGTDYQPLNNGWQLKIDKKISYKLVDDDILISKTLKALREAGEDGEIMAQSIIKSKDELSLSFYNSMPPSYRTIAGAIVASTVASPTVSLMPPKEPKVANKF